jgi:GGDEF domain-containing protein
MACRMPLQARHKDGTEFPVEIMLSPLDQDHVLAVLRDITTARDMSDRVRQLAYSDTLTGLPNRAALSRDLAVLLNTSPQPTPTRMSVALFDLDSFKEINDKMGHLNGDARLRRWSITGAAASRGSAFIPLGRRRVRLAGHEFRRSS